MPTFKKVQGSESDIRTTKYQGREYTLTGPCPNFGRKLLCGEKSLDNVRTIKDAGEFVIFHGQVMDYLEGLGAVPGDHYGYVVKTPLGELRVIIRERALMCRFEDVDRASEKMGNSINNYSGKWNHQYLPDITTSEMVQHFTGALNSVMAMSA